MIRGAIQCNSTHIGCAVNRHTRHRQSIILIIELVRITHRHLSGARNVVKINGIISAGRIDANVKGAAIGRNGRGVRRAVVQIGVRGDINQKRVARADRPRARIGDITADKVGRRGRRWGS